MIKDVFNWTFFLKENSQKLGLELLFEHLKRSNFMAFVKFSSCSINFHLFSNQKSNLLFNLLKCYSNIAELFSCGNEVSYKFNFLIDARYIR